MKTTAAHRDGTVSEPFIGDDGIPAGTLTWTTKRPGQILLTIILAAGDTRRHRHRAICRTRCCSSLRAPRTSLPEREANARHEAKHDPRRDFLTASTWWRRLDAALARLGSEEHRARRRCVYRHRPVQGRQRYARARSRRSTGQGGYSERLEDPLETRRIFYRDLAAMNLPFFAAPATSNSGDALAERIAKAFQRRSISTDRAFA